MPQDFPEFSVSVKAVVAVALGLSSVSMFHRCTSLAQVWPRQLFFFQISPQLLWLPSYGLERWKLVGFLNKWTLLGRQRCERWMPPSNRCQSHTTLHSWSCRIDILLQIRWIWWQRARAGVHDESTSNPEQHVLKVIWQAWPALVWKQTSDPSFVINSSQNFVSIVLKSCSASLRIQKQAAVAFSSLQMSQTATSAF